MQAWVDEPRRPLGRARRAQAQDPAVALEATRCAMRALGAWQDPQADLHDLSTQILRISECALESESVQLLSEIGTEHLMVVAEHAPALKLKQMAPRASQVLQSAGEIEAAILWLHLTGTSLRRAKSFRAAADFFWRAGELARMHDLDERFLYAQLGCFSVCAESGNFFAAEDLLKELRKDVINATPSLRGQFALEENRYYIARNDISGLLGSAESAYGWAIDGEMRPEAVALSRGMLCNANIAADRKGKAYAHGLYATVILLMARMDFALIRFVDSFRSSLDMYRTGPEMERCFNLLGRFTADYRATNRVGEKVRSDALDSLLRLYAHYLEHHAPPSERYMNPLRLLVPKMTNS